MKNLKSFLVGGAVRDKLMGIEPKDHDYVVVGSNGNELLALGFEQVGMGFPVFLHPETNEEYALARREKKVGAGYTGFEFETGLDVTLTEDLERRDLTMNSMALNGNDQLVDPFGGMTDLKNKVLRHTSSSFGEDPLRVVRLARFFARYDTFTVADETMRLASYMVHRGDLDELPDERFWREIEKAFADGCTARFWELLFEIGALQKVRFFQTLFGTDWMPGRFMHIVRVANSFSTQKYFSKEDTPHMFAAAVAPPDVTKLFASVDAAKVHNALNRVRVMRKPPTATEVHELITSVRGYSYENRALSQLVNVLRALAIAGEFLPVRASLLESAANIGARVSAEDFIELGFKGKELGEAIAQDRKSLIAAMLNLQIS